MAERLRAVTTERHVPGEPGIWILIFGDMTVFALLFGAFIHGFSQEPEIFEASQRELTPSFGAINTILLLTSSLFVAIAIPTLRSGGSRALATRLFSGALACGLGFVFLKVVEYSQKINADLTPGTNDFWMFFYVLTGLHLFHLLCGLIVLAFLITQARRPELSSTRMSLVEGGASFWHMVDLLWIVLFPLLYFVN